MPVKKESGTKYKPVCIKMPPWLNDALNVVDNKSGYIQKAVIRQLINDGYGTIISKAKEAGLL